jgi:hypothetical protein
MLLLKEWGRLTHRFAWGERYLYIKVVVIGREVFCGKEVKRLVRGGKLSFTPVDKPVESVEKRWIDPMPTTPSLLKTLSEYA